jgi:hypothetical protein
MMEQHQKEYELLKSSERKVYLWEPFKNESVAVTEYL